MWEFYTIKEIEFVESQHWKLASGNEFNSMFSEEEIYRLKNSSIDRTIYSLVKQKITVNDDEERPFRSTNVGGTLITTKVKKAKNTMD